MTKYQQRVLEAVLDYYDLGFCLLPVAAGSKSFGGEWKHYQTERPSREQVKAWFSEGEDRNIRIICGKVSGNLVVLDFDSESGYREFLTNNSDIERKTPVVKTAKGYHVYLRTKQPIKSIKLPKLDVQSEGKYVIAPPSLHPSGVTYYFVSEIREPMVIDNLGELGISPAKPLKPRLALKGHLIITPETIRPRWLRESVSKGERNNHAFRVACYFFKHYPRSRAEALITQWAYKFCEDFPDKSFTEEALKATINSAYNTVKGVK